MRGKRRLLHLALSLAVVLIGGFVIGCDSGGADNSGDVAVGADTTQDTNVGGDIATTTDATTSPPAQDCQSRCVTKGVSCEAPVEAAEEGCVFLCEQGLSEEELQCFEAQTCEVIATGEYCGLGEPDGPTCGNDICEDGETEGSCPADCGDGPVPSCGDGVCNGEEDESSCPSDCGGTGPICGNGTCEAGETSTSCSDDCSGPPPSVDEVVVRARFGDRDVTYAGNPPAALLNLSGKPTFEPEFRDFPSFSGATPETATPNPGSCDLKFSTFMNTDEVGVQMNSDNPNCFDYMETLAESGLTLVYSNLEKSGLGGEVDITIELRP